jgi:hypothetical protein
VFDRQAVRSPSVKLADMKRKAMKQIKLQVQPKRDLLPLVAAFENLLSLTFCDSIPIASFTTFIHYAFGYSTTAPGKLLNLRSLKFWSRSAPGQTVAPIFYAIALAASISKTCKKLSVLRLPPTETHSHQDAEAIFRSLSSLPRLAELEFISGRFGSDWSIFGSMPKFRKLVLGSAGLGDSQDLIYRCLENREKAMPLALLYCAEKVPFLAVLPAELGPLFLEIVNEQERRLDREYLVDFLLAGLERGKRFTLAILDHPTIAEAAKKPATIDVDLQLARLLMAPFSAPDIATQFFEKIIQFVLAPYITEESAVCDLRSLPLALREELRAQIAAIANLKLLVARARLQGILPSISGLLSNSELLSVYCCGFNHEALKILDEEARLQRSESLILVEERLFLEPLIILAKTEKAEDVKVRANHVLFYEMCALTLLSFRTYGIELFLCIRKLSELIPRRSVSST